MTERYYQYVSCVLGQWCCNFGSTNEVLHRNIILSSDKQGMLWLKWGWEFRAPTIVSFSYLPQEPVGPPELLVLGRCLDQVCRMATSCKHWRQDKSSIKVSLETQRGNTGVLSCGKGRVQMEQN